jgi:hypothetical protein
MSRKSSFLTLHQADREMKGKPDQEAHAEDRTVRKQQHPRIDQGNTQTFRTYIHYAA